MFRRYAVLSVVLALTGCTVNVAGFPLWLKPQLAKSQDVSNSRAPSVEAAPSIHFSEAAGAVLNITDVSSVGAPYKLVFVSLEDNFDIRRVVRADSLDPLDIPEGLAPTYVKCSTDPEVFTRVSDKQNADYAWYMPKPTLFDGRTVSARFGSAVGAPIKAFNVIGSYGVGDTQASGFVVQFPLIATGDFELSLTEGYAYVHWDQHSETLKITPRLRYSDFRNSCQPATTSINFQLNDQAGLPIYGLSMSDLECSILGPFGSFDDGRLFEVSSGSYKLEASGTKLADQPNLLKVHLAVPRFKVSAEEAFTR